MTQNDILILAKAGFTAQQIAALSVTQVPAAQEALAALAVPSPAPAVPPAAQAALTALAVPSPAPAVPPAAPAAQAAQAAPLTYDQFQHELQKMALLGAHQSGKVETADSVLASIINPPAITEGGK